MTDADPFSIGNTPEKSNSSKDSVQPTDPTALSPAPPSNESSNKSLVPTEKPSYIPLSMECGSLEKITNSITKAISQDMTPEAKAATVRFLDKNSRGFVGGLAMLCRGRGVVDERHPGKMEVDQCPILEVCPIAEAGDPFPLNKPCPFEQSLVQIWVNKHLTALGIEDFDSPENSFDLDLLYELAGHELLKWKAAQHLAHSGRIVEERQVAAGLQGDQIFGEVMSPALEAIDIQSKITMKLREALLATRKAQIQAGKDMGDPSRKTAELARKAKEKAQSRLKIQRENIEDAEFEVKE
jgi:hypothetical protein